MTTPANHLRGEGCPICNESRLEKEISEFLNENGIEYERQKRFDWLGKMSLDFYLPKHNIAIECQGAQHFEPVGFFGGFENFKLQYARDNDKLSKCNDKRNYHIILFKQKIQ